MSASVQNIFALWKDRPALKRLVPKLPIVGKTPSALVISERKNKFLFRSITGAAHRSGGLLYEKV